jgi:hypothetical protein
MAKGKWQMENHLNFAPATRDHLPFELPFVLNEAAAP